MNANQIQDDIDPVRAKAIDPHDGMPDQCVEALQTIIADIDQYLSSWLERLQREITSQPSATTAAQCGPERLQQFLREKSLWEAERNLQAEQIQEKADQLTQAWLRLESEQREFLQTKEAHRLLSRERPAVVGSTHGDADVESRVAAVHSSENPHAEPMPQRPGGVERDAGRVKKLSSADGQTESAVRQFKQLKRAIASSRPSSESR